MALRVSVESAYPSLPDLFANFISSPDTDYQPMAEAGGMLLPNEILKDGATRSIAQTSCIGQSIGSIRLRSHPSPPCEAPPTQQRQLNRFRCRKPASNVHLPPMSHQSSNRDIRKEDATLFHSKVAAQKAGFLSIELRVDVLKDIFLGQVCHIIYRAVVRHTVVFVGPHLSPRGSSPCYHIDVIARQDGRMKARPRQ